MKALRVPRLFTGLVRLLAAGSALTLTAFMLTDPQAGLADTALPIDGTLSVNIMSAPTAPGIFSIVANGIGSTSHVGNLFFELHKTINFNDGTMLGTFTMTDENGDTLTGNYAGVINAPNSKGFALFSGQLTFTAGTGRFLNVTGTVSFSAMSNRGTGQAVYSFKGSISLPGSGG